MSATFDKKADAASRRQGRIQKEQQEKRKMRIIAVTVVVVLLVLFVCALVANSKFLRRSMTALTIGNVNFTAVDYDYFFNNSYRDYQNYINQQMGDYASQMLPSTDTPLSSQIYDQQTGETWADFISEYAISQMQQLAQYYDAAKADVNYTLPDSERAAIDQEITNLKQAAESYSSMYSSFDDLIRKLYGDNINEKSLRKITEFVHTANAYSTYIQDSFTYTPDQLTAYYADNKGMLDVYTYRYFLVNADTVTKTDYATDDEYQAAQDAAQAAARDKATQIAAGIKTEDDFIAAALAYDPVANKDPSSTLKSYPGSWLGSYYGPWMRDNEHSYGDITTADMTTGTYVVFFISRDSNDYPLAQMRQILIKRDTVNASDYENGTDDPGYIEALNTADAAAKQRADDVYKQFVDGGATEDKLIELMADNSDDTTAGGLYDSISKNESHNKMDQEIEDWLFADGRKPGDYQMIRTDADGYHIVYFIGYGEKFCDYLADNEMRNNDYKAWQDSLAAVTPVKHWAFRLKQN